MAEYSDVERLALFFNSGAITVQNQQVSALRDQTHIIPCEHKWNSFIQEQFNQGVPTYVKVQDGNLTRYDTINNIEILDADASDSNPLMHQPWMIDNRLGYAFPPHATALAKYIQMQQAIQSVGTLGICVPMFDDPIHTVQRGMKLVGHKHYTRFTITTSKNHGDAQRFRLTFSDSVVYCPASSAKEKGTQQYKWIHAPDYGAYKKDETKEQTLSQIIDAKDLALQKINEWREGATVPKELEDMLAGRTEEVPRIHTLLGKLVHKHKKRKGYSTQVQNYLKLCSARRANHQKRKRTQYFDVLENDLERVLELSMVNVSKVHGHTYIAYTGENQRRFYDGLVRIYESKMERAQSVLAESTRTMWDQYGEQETEVPVTHGFVRKEDYEKLMVQCSKNTSVDLYLVGVNIAVNLKGTLNFTTQDQNIVRRLVESAKFWKVPMSEEELLDEEMLPIDWQNGPYGCVVKEEFHEGIPDSWDISIVVSGHNNRKRMKYTRLKYFTNLYCGDKIPIIGKYNKSNQDYRETGKRRFEDFLERSEKPYDNEAVLLSGMLTRYINHDQFNKGVDAWLRTENMDPINWDNIIAALKAESSKEYQKKFPKAKPKDPSEPRGPSFIIKDVGTDWRPRYIAYLEYPTNE